MWTRFPGFMKISWFVQKLSWDLPQTGRQADKCQGVVTNLSAITAALHYTDIPDTHTVVFSNLQGIVISVSTY